MSLLRALAPGVPLLGATTVFAIPATNAGCPIQAVLWLEWDNGCRFATPRPTTPVQGKIRNLAGVASPRCRSLHAHFFGQIFFAYRDVPIAGNALATFPIHRFIPWLGCAQTI